MRIATWNLEGKWTQRHQLLVRSLRADIILLTEVPDSVEIPGMAIHRGAGEMPLGGRWAAIGSRASLGSLPDPHGATALAEVGGLRVASSVLPWKGCGGGEPWCGLDMGTRTTAAVDDVEAAAPSIWGGDWNHELTGRLYTGSVVGRARILAALDGLEFRAATAEALHHRLPLALSIDHVAVPADWTVNSVEHHSGIVDGVALSDHDAYVVEID